MKIKVLYWLGFIFLLSIQTSCIENNSTLTKNVRSDFINPFSEGNLDNNKELKVFARFSECGEWGGHEEELKVYTDVNNIFFAKHIIYSVNCDAARNSGFSKNSGIVSDKKVQLTHDKKELVNKYLQNLVKAKNGEHTIVGHASNYFSATLSDSSYHIEFREDAESISKEYAKLISALY
jgi:hypothetical protein